MSLEPFGRFAFVVQRCGESINAGAERYVLNFAKALANEGFDTDIYTTQALSYRTWANALPEVEAIHSEGGSGKVRILRYPTVVRRKTLLFRVFRLVSLRLKRCLPGIYGWLSFILDRLFLWAQGPWCPALVQALSESAHQYRAVVVKCYLYAPSALVLESLAKTKTPSVFIVTAHDEPEFRLNFVLRSLKNATMLGFVSHAEQSLCYRLWPASAAKASTLLHPGLDEFLLDDLQEGEWGAEISVPSRFCLLLGRVEPNKGLKILDELVPADCQIVLAGDSEVQPHPDRRFVYTGRVTEPQKKWLLRNARALLVVSRFEAYSMVTAEAQAVGCPVLALAGCDPVEELVAKYGGAVVSRDDFGEAVRRVLGDDKYRASIAPKSNLIREQRSWHGTAQQLIHFLEKQKGEAVV